jgi:hypothetical protein
VLGVLSVVADDPPRAGSIPPNSTAEERQEYLRLYHSCFACNGVLNLAIGIEVMVNAWFSLHFFEQQVGTCSVLAVRIHLLVYSFVLVPLRSSLSHSGWSEW